MVEGSYFLWEWGGRAVSSIPTSTLHPRLPILLPHALSLVSSLTHHDFWSVGSPSRTGFSHGWSVHPHAEVDGLFILPMAC